MTWGAAAAEGVLAVATVIALTLLLVAGAVGHQGAAPVATTDPLTCGMAAALVREGRYAAMYAMVTAVEAGVGVGVAGAVTFGRRGVAALANRPCAVVVVVMLGVGVMSPALSAP